MLPEASASLLKKPAVSDLPECYGRNQVNRRANDILNSALKFRLKTLLSRNKINKAKSWEYRIVASEITITAGLRTVSAERQDTVFLNKYWVINDKTVFTGATREQEQIYSLVCFYIFPAFIRNVISGVLLSVSWPCLCC